MTGAVVAVVVVKLMDHLRVCAPMAKVRPEKVDTVADWWKSKVCSKEEAASIWARNTDELVVVLTWYPAVIESITTQNER